MSRYDARIKAVEKRIPRDYGDGADIVTIGPEMDENGIILNPDEYFQASKRGQETIYIGYTDEAIKSIEDQRFLYWQSKDEGM